MSRARALGCCTSSCRSSGRSGRASARSRTSAASSSVSRPTRRRDGANASPTSVRLQREFNEGPGSRSATSSPPRGSRRRTRVSRRPSARSPRSAATRWPRPRSWTRSSTRSSARAERPSRPGWAPSVTASVRRERRDRPSTDALLAQVDGYLAQGYRRIKLKIEPGTDVERVRAVRAAHPTSCCRSTRTPPTTSPTGDVPAIDDLGLLMIEQPLHHEDLVQHAELQALLATDLCLDESIRSAADAVAALGLGACRIVNVKQGRVGGSRRPNASTTRASLAARPSGAAACSRRGSAGR